jgi:hypothetical protein
MSFTTFSGVTSLFFAAAAPPPPLPEFSAAFGVLSALGQVPITINMGKITTYSMLNNGVEIATDQTATTYTITGLGDNIQIGPITLVPYDSLGVAGSPFTVNGGSGAGMIYTWAQADAPTFSSIKNNSVTLNCTGTFSQMYVIYSGGAATPVSGTLITSTNNRITQVYTGMSTNIPYRFTVYPVNSDGIPASATGLNMSSATISTTMPWIIGGNGVNSVGTNSLAYSTNATNWSGVGTIPSIVNCIAYNLTYKYWLAGGNNTFVYSTDATNWTGFNTGVFSQDVYCIEYSTAKKYWIAGGSGGNTLAYSTDGMGWTGLGGNIFISSCRCVTYGTCWAAGGNGGNILAYSSNGINWTSTFTDNNSTTYGIAYSGNKNVWISVGNYPSRTIMKSLNGIIWNQSINSMFSLCGYCVRFSETQLQWMAGGSGNRTLMYSIDGAYWNEVGNGLCSTVYGISNSAFYNTMNAWVAVGEGNNLIAYSHDGRAWYGGGNGPFTTTILCVANSSPPLI